MVKRETETEFTSSDDQTRQRTEKKAKKTQVCQFSCLSLDSGGKENVVVPSGDAASKPQDGDNAVPYAPLDFSISRGDTGD